MEKKRSNIEFSFYNPINDKTYHNDAKTNFSSSPSSSTTDQQHQVTSDKEKKRRGDWTEDRRICLMKQHVKLRPFSAKNGSTIWEKIAASVNTINPETPPLMPDTCRKEARHLIDSYNTKFSKSGVRRFKSDLEAAIFDSWLADTSFKKAKEESKNKKQNLLDKEAADHEAQLRMAILGKKRKLDDGASDNKEDEEDEDEDEAIITDEQFASEHPSPISYTIPSPSFYELAVPSKSNSESEYETKKLRLAEKLLETQQKILEVSQKRLDIDQKRLELETKHSICIEEVLKEIISQKALLAELLKKKIDS